ncbi:hypothetical protein EOPP23_17430 [Endozoicomonas sp. OPT23]|uniref:metallophosphoesterase n=1 Tax=Endozoicomonas sp. OPT23 TaxID=2072845 RepID=UPI00129AE144|nr:metallophosphoesterase [Endozoicomonas sp. OPT23]MRI34766.1 hypothetical protein [Endozoicomonas sp. OPT23]
MNTIIVSLLLILSGTALSLSAPVKAEVITTCPSGMIYQDQVCYQPCPEGFFDNGPTCRGACPKGYSWDSLACSGGFLGLDTKVPALQTRKTALPSTCSSSNIRKPITPGDNSSPFTLIFSSDPQYPWWRGAHDSACSSEECVKEKSAGLIADQIQSMNNMVNIRFSERNETITGTWPDTSNIPASRRDQPIPDPQGVVVNGDLTAFWHSWQVEKYMSFYHRNDADPLNPHNLKLDFYPGLGNHDYANNKNDCWWQRNAEYLPYKANGCARNAAHYIKKLVSCDLAPNFPDQSITGFNESSLAYSWDIGNYHFVQLHNYPGYTYSDVNVSDSYEWLRSDLEIAHNAGQRIVLNMHDSGADLYSLAFRAAISERNVVAIFSGHLHEQNGFVGSVNNGSQSIPIFRSGASEYSTLLLAEFGANHLTVAVVETFDGIPVFRNPDNSYKTRTLLFE